jgi:uncharacterized protein (DUF2141 family)
MGYRSGFLFFVALLISFTAGNAWAASVSGTVINNSGKNGRVYLRVSGSGTPGNLGVSIASPGAFTIRGLSNGDYQLSAFMDVDSVNTGMRLANSPVGQSNQFTISNNEDEPGVNITLLPPDTIIPQAPDGLFAVPCSSGKVFLVWETPEDANGFQAAEAYNIYWSTSSSVSPTSYQGSILNIPASDQDFAVISGLTYGATYYFVMTSKVGSTVSSPSSPAEVQIGTPPGSYTISGTVSFSGFTGNTARPVNIAAVDEAGQQMRITSATPSSGATSVTFTISGVPNGTYEIFAFIDNNGNGYLDLGDYQVAEENTPIVPVNGANVTNVAATITNVPVFASIRTLHWRNMAYGNEGYGLTFEVVQSVKRPVNVAVTAGPNISSPLDIGIQEDWGGFDAWLSDTARPSTDDDYTFHVVYSDGSEDLTVSPSGVLDSFATPLSPIGPVTDVTMPTFYWSGPASPPVWYDFRVELSDVNWGRIWETDDLPMGTTSTPYNGQPLSLNSEYIWNIVLSDRQGNYTMYSANFTPIDPAVTKVLTATKVGPDSNSVLVSPPGEYLPHSPFSYAINSEVTLTAVPDADSMVNWTGCDSTQNNTCYVTMSSDKSVTATFVNYDYRVQLNGAGKTGIQAAFNDAVNGCIIKARADHFDEADLRLNTSPSNVVTLKGGYEQTFTSNSGNYSYLNGILTVMNGILTVENIVIE